MKFCDLLPGDSFQFLDAEAPTGSTRRFVKIGDDKMRFASDRHMILRAQDLQQQVVNAGARFDHGRHLLEVGGLFTWIESGRRLSDVVTLDDVINSGYANTRPWMLVIKNSDPQSPVRMVWPVRREDRETVTMYVRDPNPRSIHVKCRVDFQSPLIKEFRRVTHSIVADNGETRKLPQHLAQHVDFYLANEQTVDAAWTIARYELEHIATRRAEALASCGADDGSEFAEP
jgi:hypothetical protein